MSDARPNIVFVLTDQQRWDTVGAYGGPHDLTPNVDELAGNGTTFERTFTPQPLCGPARASLQTGQYATEHGVWKNGIPLPEDEPAVAERLRRVGYEVGYVGKWHLASTGTDPVPPARRGGYDGYWRAADVLEFTSRPYEGYVYDEDGTRIEFDEYRVDAMTGFAESFIQEKAGDEDPFFLFLSYLEPHHQNDMEAYVAPDGYAEKYPDPHVPGDLSNRPGDWAEALPEYYGIVERIDECVGDLVETLESTGVREDTVVVFTSDHGSHFKTRNWEYKRSCHESSIRVPAVVDGPGFEGGNRVPELVSLLDLPPTVLDVAGAPIPDTMSGESLLPLVAGDRDPGDWRDAVFVQLSEAEVGRAIRTDRWKYSVYAPEPDPWEDEASDAYVERYLYDLASDPHERVNLIGHPQFEDVAADLRSRLADRIEAVEDGRPTIRKQEYQVW